MRTKTYIGTFISDGEHKYTLEVHCSGFIQAFILLTADAIRSGQHYQLATIVDEVGNSMNVGDILKIGNILTN